jgi:hypothetical protein
MALVFQYGSNMSSERLNDPTRLRRKAVDLGVAVTRERFELVFDLLSEKAEPPCAAADIIGGRGRNIWGVIYDIPDYLITRGPATPHDQRTLDSIEGKKYQRNDVRLSWPNGEPITDRVITYVGRPEYRDNTIQTSSNYVVHIFEGIREHGISNEYADYVRTTVLKNNPALRQDLFPSLFSFCFFLIRHVWAKLTHAVSGE